MRYLRSDLGRITIHERRQDASQRWFQTLPGILTTLTGTLTALAGLIVAIPPLWEAVFNKNKPPAHSRKYSFDCDEACDGTKGELPPQGAWRIACLLESYGGIGLGGPAP